MNHWKKGERLLEEIYLAASNAKFYFTEKRTKKNILKEKELLEKLIAKAKSRIEQVDEELKQK